MSEGITVQDAIDLGVSTLAQFPKGEFEYVLEHNDYPFINRLYTGRDVDIQTGQRIERDIVLGKTGNAGHVKLFQKDRQKITNLIKKLGIDWRHAKSSLSYEIREILVQNGPEALVDLLKIRRTNMYTELADEIEPRLWLSSDDPTDEVNPFGIPYWLPVGADSQEGFIAGNPKYSDVDSEIAGGAGGISSDVYEKWKSYFFDYENLSADDFLKKLSRAMRRTHFKSPVMVDSKTGNEHGNNFTLFTDDYVISELEEYAFDNDDNIGADLGKYAGAVTFKRIPIEYCDLLDDDSGTYTHLRGAHPIYGINWKFFELIMLKGDKFRESEPIKDREYHNVLTVFLDLSYNMICTNRMKAGFVGSMVAA